MSVDRGLRTTFNDVAALYDDVRPGYPEQLIEDVILLSGIPPGGSILEIGCGTGKATLPFARRGYTMLCLELGANPAKMAAKHCLPYPGVQVQNVSFEEWPLGENEFDLALCAEAFHWISPEIRLVKTASSLKDGGSIALFWNGHHGGTSHFFEEADELYRKRAPQLMEMKETPPEELEKETVEEIDRSGLFGDVVVRRYPWRETYTAEKYVKLLNTYSPIQRLTEDARRNLLAEIRELVNRYGGVVESWYVSRLYVARVEK